jgi:HAD superfamily hydrolase (TIGR01509 family)
MLSAEKGLPQTLHDFINDMKQQYTMELIYSHCKPRFHHEYALSRLKKHGYKLAVASNSIKDTVRLMMERSGLEGYLDLYLSNQDVTNSKPDPEIYISAAKKLGVNPNECLILEDNFIGKKAAKLSGAWLMEINETDEVNYLNIIQKIYDIEERFGD